MHVRFALGFPAYLRFRVSLDEARAEIRSRLARREENFLAWVGKAIFGCPKSPYRALFAHAGCEPGDLAARVNAVTPVLAWWHTPGPLAAVDVAEVARVVRVPVAELLDPAHRFTSVFGPFKGPGFEVDGLFVWGFTAMLLSALFDLGGLTQRWDEGHERELPDRVLSPWMRGLSS